jgi:hypothetical protein
LGKSWDGGFRSTCNKPALCYFNPRTPGFGRRTGTTGLSGMGLQ